MGRKENVQPGGRGKKQKNGKRFPGGRDVIAGVVFNFAGFNLPESFEFPGLKGPGQTVIKRGGMHEAFAPGLIFGPGCSIYGIKGV